MKYLVYVLLLANLGVFAWLYTHQDDYRPAQPVATALPPPIEPLVLLNERNKPSSETPAVTSAAAPSEPAPMPAPVQVTEPPPVSDPAPTAEGTVPDPGSLAAAEDTQAELTGPVREDMPDQTDTQPAPDPEPAAPMPRVCQTIGPFTESEMADAFSAQLTALGQSVVRRTAETEQPSGYWVYLPSMPRAEARRTIDELAVKGVKDYFLGRQNYISLGIFSDRRMAENRVREITGLGYRPQLEPRFVTREVYWLDFEENGPDYISAEQWRSLLEAQPELRRQTLTCE